MIDSQFQGTTTICLRRSPMSSVLSHSAFSSLVFSLPLSLSFGSHCCLRLAWSMIHIEYLHDGFSYFSILFFIANVLFSSLNSFPLLLQQLVILKAEYSSQRKMIEKMWKKKLGDLDAYSNTFLVFIFLSFLSVEHVVHETHTI